MSYVVDKDVVVEMRDGARLATDVYRPTGAAPTPVLLLRTPYDKERMLAVTAVYANIPRFVGAGYTIAVQDVRGRFGSDGVFVPQSDLETADGEDTIAWAASQGWSTGRVGMFGASYQSTTQLLAGVARPPALAALALSVTPSDFYATLAYPGGAFGLGVHLGWYLGIAQNASARRVHAGELQPSVQADGLAALEAFGDACERTPLADQALLEATTPMYRTWLEHPARDAFWQRLSLDGRHAAINAPGLHIGGWYDLFLRGTLNNFSELARAGNAPQRLIFGPWAHVNQLGARFRSSNSAKWSR